jgi:hypothetical protein
MGFSEYIRVYFDIFLKSEFLFAVQLSPIMRTINVVLDSQILCLTDTIKSTMGWTIEKIILQHVDFLFTKTIIIDHTKHPG